MLSILDPVEIDNLALFRDDEDPRKFYLLPDQPVIVNDDKGVPDFLFIKYIKDLSTTPDGQPIGGGYVQFRTVLTIDDARRARVVDALRQQLTQDQQSGRKPFGNPITSTEPVLADPLWTSGTVAMETFKVGDNEMVRKATATAAVDLAGSLGASVDLQLDPDGAEIFWTSFKNFADQQIPILITYKLTYKARVAATMEIHASRSTVEQQIWQRARWHVLDLVRARWYPMETAIAVAPGNFGAVQALAASRVAALVEPGQIQDAIHNSITNGSITVKISTDEAGSGQDDANKVQDMLFKVATEVLSGRVIPVLFGDTPSAQLAGSKDDPAVSKELYELKVDTSSTTTTTFDIDLTSTSTIERDCNPNGPIHLMIQNPDVLRACFKELRLSDGFFGVMRVVAATAGISFQRDGISMIHVYQQYDQVDEANPDRPRVQRSDDGTLKSEADTLHFKPIDLARDATGSHERAYSYRTDVFYAGGELKISNDWAACSDTMLLINPAAMGALRVELNLTAPKDQVRGAKVSLSYRKASGELLSDDIDLTPDANRKTWFRPTGEIGTAGAALPARQYTYTVVYDVGATKITMPSVAATSDSLELPGPFERVLSFVLRPQGSFDGVTAVSGDVRYDDPAHGYQVVQPFTLDKLSASVSITVPVMPDGPAEITWTARVNHTDGSFHDLPGGRAPAGTVWIGEAVDRFLTVQIVTDLVDFDHDVQLALVHLSYRDPANGIAADQTYTFNKANKAGTTWRVGLRESSPNQYAVEIRYVAYDRTKNSEVDVASAQDPVLVLDRQAH
ncbi:MAG: hypothetical protein ACHQE5_01190 [Actinomycetes bacterium]